MLRGKVRAALAGASSFEEFSDRLSRDGVLIRLRMSVQDPHEVTGYAVALRPHGANAAEGAEPVWFGGGKLAPDLTLPQLQARWCRERGGGSDCAAATGATDGVRAGLDLDHAERQALWDAAARAIGRADEQLLAAAGGDRAVRAMAEAAAVAAGEVLSSVSRLTERSGAGPIHQAAAAYDRAARGLRRRPPIPTGPARRTRQAAGGLRGMKFVRQSDARRLMQTLDQLSGLSLALAGLRDQQGHAAQAAAARRSAELITAERRRLTVGAQAAALGLTPPPVVRRPTAPSAQEPLIPSSPARFGGHPGHVPGGRSGRT